MIPSYDERLARTIALLGKEQSQRIFKTSVMIIGCGAVGGYALEMIARLGFGKIFVVDFDTFEASNLNRQILATVSSMAKKKCVVAKERCLSINPDASVIDYDLKITPDNLDFILSERPDFVIDAIDDVPAKTALLAFLAEHNIKVFSAMGAALKTKSELLKASTLDKTQGCHLAKKLREALRTKGIDLRKINCVYSSEPVKICKDEQGHNILGSLPMVPAVMGTMLASLVLESSLID